MAFKTNILIKKYYLNSGVKSLNFSLQYKKHLSNLKIINAYDIIYSRRYFGEYVCGCHYLCRPMDMSRYVLTTPAGEVVEQAILRAHCY